MNDRGDHIFRGRIEHFSKKPGGLAVDWFKDDDIKNLYFISHAHSDHIPGLFTRNFCKLLKSRPHARIFCTEITRSIIMRLPSYAKTDVLDELDKHFVLLEPDEMREINFCDNDGNPTGKKMKVRTIPANHIPGAVMFLFEDDEKRVLYTGDFRYDVREENDEMSVLRNFVETYDEVIDYLYVDVTCLDLGRLFHPDQNKLPSRPEITETVIELIKDKTPSSVHIDATPLGAESMVKSVAEFLNNSADSILDRLEDDCKRKELYRYMLRDIRIPSTEDASETDIHIFNGCIFKTATEQEYEDYKKCDKDTMRIRASLKWLFKTPSKKYCHSDQGTWSKKLNREDRDYWKVLYSHHSSDAELREFLSRLKFKEVFPICKPFSRNKFEEIYIYPEISSVVEEKSLYLFLDHPSPTYREKSHVFWLTRLRVNQHPANLSDDKFLVTVKEFENSDGILSAVKHCDQPINSIVIQCTIELQRSVGKLYCNLFRFIETLKKEIVTKSKDSNNAAQKKETIDTVLFYSTTNNMNDQWKQIINSIRLYRNKDVPKVFYVDLTKVPEYNKKPRYDIENRIIDETLKNLIRNKDKEVFVSDWPMPYEYSERKREYDQENSDLENVRENKRVKFDINENMESGDTDYALREDDGQSDEPQSQEIEMTEPQM